MDRRPSSSLKVCFLSKFLENSQASMWKMRLILVFFRLDCYEHVRSVHFDMGKSRQTMDTRPSSSLKVCLLSAPKGNFEKHSSKHVEMCPVMVFLRLDCCTEGLEWRAWPLGWPRYGTALTWPWLHVQGYGRPWVELWLLE